MEETVMNNAGFEVETPVTGDAEQEISMAELLGEERQQEPAQTVNGGGDGQQQEAEPNRQDEQAERNRVYAGMERSLRARYQREYDEKLRNDPAYTFGSRMLQYIAQSQGLSLEDAANFANAQYIQAIAQSEGVSVNVARQLYNQHHQQPAQPQAFSPEARAQEIRKEIAEMEMPEGFNFDEAIKDENFAQMLIDYPTSAAVRIYHAEKRAKEAPAAVAEQIRARAAIPQPMKPQQPVTPTQNYKGMTDDQFFEFDSQLE